MQPSLCVSQRYTTGCQDDIASVTIEYWIDLKSILNFCLCAPAFPMQDTNIRLTRPESDRLGNCNRAPCVHLIIYHTVTYCG